MLRTAEPAIATVFSTSDVHPRDSLAYWNEIATRGFTRTTVSAGRTFNGRLTVGSVGSLVVSTFECDPLTASRGRREISGADNDDYYICLQKTGRSTNMPEGTFFLLDPRRPFVGRLETPGTVVTIRVPRRELEARTGPTGALISRTLDPQNAVASLAFGFLSLLPAHVDTLDASAADKIAGQALDLVALAFSAELQLSGTNLSTPRAAALTLLKAAIESRLHDPELKPATAAEVAGISVRYANALLAEEDSGLEAYIIARRLERCRRALSDPAQARRTIGDIAFGWGFSDLSHFTRRFKAQYGCSPRDFRRQHA